MKTNDIQNVKLTTGTRGSYHIKTIYKGLVL